MEIIINRRLLHVIEERRLLPETQYGFRKNRSTTDVLITLDSLISETIRKKGIQRYYLWTYLKHTTPVGGTAHCKNCDGGKKPITPVYKTDNKL
jgi:hypothetical protein